MLRLLRLALCLEGVRICAWPCAICSSVPNDALRRRGFWLGSACMPSFEAPSPRSGASPGGLGGNVACKARGNFAAAMDWDTTAKPATPASGGPDAKDGKTSSWPPQYLPWRDEARGGLCGGPWILLCLKKSIYVAGER